MMPVSMVMGQSVSAGPLDCPGRRDIYLGLSFNVLTTPAKNWGRVIGALVVLVVGYSQ